jgi:hypothetical protein
MIFSRREILASLLSSVGEFARSERTTLPMKLVQFQMPDGTTLQCTPDYYKENGIRKPVGLTKALEIADREGLRLPTVEEVNAIYNAAQVKLSPIFMRPGPEMTTQAYWEEHDRRINDQLTDLGYTPDQWENLLIAGHKKDIINISRNSGRVAIYGWHRINGEPVQPYSTVHHREYFDYSHGLRLVNRIG